MTVPPKRFYLAATMIYKTKPVVNARNAAQPYELVLCGLCSRSYSWYFRQDQTPEDYAMYDKDELAAAIKKLLSHEMSEEQQNSYVVEMSNNILDPEWMDYIFQTDEFRDQDGNLDVDNVCGKILSYRPIIL